jgi:hypothetical protein
LSNGLDFPSQPVCLKSLTTLEERLVAPRLPFMRVVEVGCDRQSQLRGNVVNVPIKLDKTVSILPRDFNDTKIIQLKLMRRMAYKKPYLYETIRPNVVLEALEYLLKQPAYVEENIQLSVEWKKQYDGDAVNFKLKYDEDDNFQELNTSVSNLSLKEILDEDEQEIENNNEDQNPGGDETLMYDTIDHLILEKYKFAPGEDEIPIPILMDKYAEELSFPKIYCGKKRKLKEKLRFRVVRLQNLK